MSKDDSFRRHTAFEKQLAALHPVAGTPPWEHLMFAAGQAASLARERSRARRLVASLSCLSAVLAIGLVAESVALRKTAQEAQRHQDLKPPSVLAVGNGESHGRAVLTNEVDSVEQHASRFVSRMAPRISVTDGSHEIYSLAYLAVRRQGPGDAALEKQLVHNSPSPPTTRPTLDAGNNDHTLPAQKNLDRQALLQRWLRAANSRYGDAS